MKVRKWLEVVRKEVIMQNANNRFLQNIIYIYNTNSI